MICSILMSIRRSESDVSVKEEISRNKRPLLLEGNIVVSEEYK